MDAHLYTAHTSRLLYENKHVVWALKLVDASSETIPSCKIAKVFFEKTGCFNHAPYLLKLKQTPWSWCLYRYWFPRIDFLAIVSHISVLLAKPAHLPSPGL